MPEKVLTHEDAMRLVVEECFQLRLKKHHDYGARGIMRKGEAGIVIRLEDKLSRLDSLLIKKLERGADPRVDESMRDTWLDIACYGIIGVMLEDGTFELPASWERDGD